MPLLLGVLTRRWWLVLALVIVGAVSALIYSKVQQPLYTSSIALRAQLSPALLTNQQRSDGRTLLLDGPDLRTLEYIEQSPSMLDRIARTLHRPLPGDDGYALVVSMPSATHIKITVDGPDPEVVRHIMALVAATVDPIAQSEFFVSLSPVGGGTAVRQFQPETGRHVILGGAAGLLVGCVLSAWTVSGSVEETSRKRPKHQRVVPRLY